MECDGCRLREQDRKPLPVQLSAGRQARPCPWHERLRRQLVGLLGGRARWTDQRHAGRERGHPDAGRTILLLRDGQEWRHEPGGRGVEGQLQLHEGVVRVGRLLPPAERHRAASVSGGSSRSPRLLVAPKETPARRKERPELPPANPWRITWGKNAMPNFRGASAPKRSSASPSSSKTRRSSAHVISRSPGLQHGGKGRRRPIRDSNPCRRRERAVS